MSDNSEQQQRTLHAAIHRYLSCVSLIGECMASACPPVGGTYRHQFTRLRTRLAFDPNPASLDESFRLLQDGMNDYALKASEHLDRHRTELSRAMRSLVEIGHDLARRQDVYHARLRKFAEQLADHAYSPDPEQLRAQLSAQANSLTSALESFSHESHSVLGRIFDEIAAIEKRVADSETTEPITNLTNRREMERQIAARQKAGTEVILLQYTVADPLPDEVAREFAVRLTAQFRPHDIIARWSPTEFLVLFQGPLEVAQNRVQQVTPWISGRYPLNDGGSIEVQVGGEMLDSALVEV